LTAEEAAASIGEQRPIFLDRVLTCPPDQVTWFGLHTLAEQDPEQAQRRWEELKQAAREELRNGHEAARTIEGADGSC
jgi:hypothetical protein